ncbi:src substrate cortactin-like [Saccostrea cucullata]|uniref:src substrate cortactin-like n=1 Tax=Saccostrea cuccullata TaxID=36930 RepID=UPI002ED2D3FF
MTFKGVYRLFRKTVQFQKRIQLMSTKSDHLQRTAENSRDQVVSIATVIGMRNESTTVKGLTLKVHERSLSFKAGQWVDTFLPGLEKVGGFSMSSSPGTLQREGTLDLAVKYSDHPPAKWIHEKCKVGTELQIRVGGDVYFDPDPDKPSPDLLLIAGGIGINPIHSILCHVTDLLESHWTNSPKLVSLLYSASSMDELIFHEDIKRLCVKNPGILSYRSFITKDKSELSSEIQGHRICREDIQSQVEKMKSHDLIVFICGPPPMIHDMENILESVGVPRQRIQYEKWWYMWKASAGHNVKAGNPPTNDEDDDWETEADFVNDVSEQEQRWGAKTIEGSGHQGSLSLSQLRQDVSQDDKTVKQKQMEEGPKASYGYGGKFGVQKDRMDKSAMGADYVAEVGKHSSQTDASRGFGGKFGVQKDRQDKAAVGFDYAGKTDKHQSQTDYSTGFGGKYGVQSDRKDKSAVGWEHQEKVEKHQSQQDYSKGFGGKYGVQKDRQDKAAVGWEHHEQVDKHESQKDYSKGFGGKFGVQKDRQDKSAVGWEHHEQVDKHESQKDYSRGFGGKYGVQTDRQDKSAVGYSSHEKVPLHPSQTDMSKGFGGKFGVDSENKDKSAGSYNDMQGVSSSYTRTQADSSSEGAKNIKARFENMAKSGEEEAKKRAEEERKRREAREEREREEQRRQQEERLNKERWEEEQRAASQPEPEPEPEPEPQQEEYGDVSYQQVHKEVKSKTVLKIYIMQ